MENEDYYFDENGLMVMTEKFLKERDYCCENGCKHCPYGYDKKTDSFKSSKKRT